MESCLDASFRSYNCCEIFRPTFHLSNGLCFSTDPTKMPLIMAPALFSNFFILLRNTSFNVDPSEVASDDKFLHHRGFSVSIDTGMDQGVWRADSLGITYGSQTFVNLKLKKITLEVKECEEEPELEYFHDYTFSNCMWEKRLLRNPMFRLPNNCKLPATHLTSLGQKFLESKAVEKEKHGEAERWCSMKEIWDLVYRDVEGPDFKEDGMYNRVMYWTKELNMSNENPCKDPCEHLEYTFTWRRQPTTNVSGARLALSMSDPQVQNANMKCKLEIHLISLNPFQWATIKEVSVLEWYDFLGKLFHHCYTIASRQMFLRGFGMLLALVGGLWLLWVGVSLVTVVQFLMATLKFCFHCLLPSENH